MASSDPLPCPLPSLTVADRPLLVPTHCTTGRACEQRHCGPCARRRRLAAATARPSCHAAEMTARGPPLLCGYSYHSEVNTRRWVPHLQCACRGRFQAPRHGWHGTRGHILLATTSRTVLVAEARAAGPVGGARRQPARPAPCISGATGAVFVSLSGAEGGDSRSPQQRPAAAAVVA